MNSSPVVSAQLTIHPRLEETVKKHLKQAWQKPIADHNRQVFRTIEKLVTAWSGPLILDTGCGTGLSSQALARKYPQSLVLGLDKSADRLSKGLMAESANYAFFRIDLEDFWPLAHQAGWQFQRQTFYYPNPWPKAEHRLRRWSMHPVLPVALACGGLWELRTNWEIYALEWAMAIELATGLSAPVEAFCPPIPETLFEKKYQESGHTLWRWTSPQPVKLL